MVGNKQQILLCITSTVCVWRNKSIPNYIFPFVYCLDVCACWVCGWSKIVLKDNKNFFPPKVSNNVLFFHVCKKRLIIVFMYISSNSMTLKKLGAILQRRQTLLSVKGILFVKVQTCVCSFDVCKDQKKIYHNRKWKLFLSLKRKHKTKIWDEKKFQVC